MASGWERELPRLVYLCTCMQKKKERGALILRRAGDGLGLPREKSNVRGALLRVLFCATTPKSFGGPLFHLRGESVICRFTVSTLRWTKSVESDTLT